MTGTGSAEVIPLELGTFAFPADELPGLRGVVVAYLVRHRAGLLLFDTGFGFGNAELHTRYQPRAVRVSDALRSVGVDPAEIDAVANCHLHADHAGQNSTFPGIPIYVQAAEWEIAHTTDHTILEWIDFDGSRYEQLDGDHRLGEDVTILAGEETSLEGRSGAPDVAAYDRSIARLRDLGSDVVRFGHDRAAWTASPPT